MTETPLIVAAVLAVTFAGLSVGYMLGRAHCHSRHPQHWHLDEPLPYTADDVRWWADDPAGGVARALIADETQVMPAYTLPERSVLARYAEPDTETLTRWQRGEGL